MQDKRNAKAQYGYMENKKKMVSSFNKYIESFEKYIESENEKSEHLSDFSSSLEKLDESLQRSLKRDVKQCAVQFCSNTNVYQGGLIC